MVGSRIRKMNALASPAVLSFVAGLKSTPRIFVKIVRSHKGHFVAEDQFGREVMLVVPSSQPPAETDNAKRFCEVLYGEGNVKVRKT
ncbi:MAG: hypothetical protein ACTS8S_00965 [Giesbergeria sp.]